MAFPPPFAIIEFAINELKCHRRCIPPPVPPSLARLAVYRGHPALAPPVVPVVVLIEFECSLSAFGRPFRLGRSIAPRADCLALPLSEYTGAGRRRHARQKQLNGSWWRSWRPMLP